MSVNASFYPLPNQGRVVIPEEYLLRRRHRKPKAPPPFSVTSVHPRKDFYPDHGPYVDPKHAYDLFVKKHPKDCPHCLAPRRVYAPSKPRNWEVFSDSASLSGASGRSSLAKSLNVSDLDSRDDVLKDELAKLLATATMVVSGNTIGEEGNAD